MLLHLRRPSEKPGFIDNAVETREYLCVTAMVDHDVVDGAPAARALAKLKKMMEKGWGLCCGAERPLLMPCGIV